MSRIIHDQIKKINDNYTESVSDRIKFFSHEGLCEAEANGFRTMTVLCFSHHVIDSKKCCFYRKFS